MSDKRMSDAEFENLFASRSGQDGATQWAASIALGEARRARSAELALQAEVEMLAQQRNDEAEFNIHLAGKLNEKDGEIARLRERMEELERNNTDLWSLLHELK